MSEGSELPSVAEIVHDFVASTKFPGPESLFQNSLLLVTLTVDDVNVSHLHLVPVLSGVSRDLRSLHVHLSHCSSVLLLLLL